MKLFKSAAALFLLAASSPVFAQSKDAAKYRKESEAIRKEVWAWENPRFKIRAVPAEYANASKVVLAHHTDLNADSKTKLAFYGFGFGGKREQTISEVVREIVRLNDKNAVTEYSELSFTQFEKSSGFYSADKTTTYIGVKVIKPNGTVKEINADDIVLTKDESFEKKAKLAIPDLQPGDILDYFISTEQELTNNSSSKDYRLLLFDDAPVLSRSFHAQLGKKYAIQYRSYNGAPDLSVSKNDDKDIIVDVEQKNIPPFETSLWVAPGLQMPFIRMDISLGYRGLGSRFMNTKKPGEVLKNTDSEEFIDDRAGTLSSAYYSGYWMKAAKDEYDAIENDAKKKAKRAGLAYKDMSEDEKAAQLYYTLRFTKLLNFDINSMKARINSPKDEYNGLAFPLFATFKAAGLDPAILVSPTRTGLRMSEIMDAKDLVSTAYMPGSGKVYSIQTIFDMPFDVPAELEGVTATKSFTFDHPAAIMSEKKMSGLTNVTAGPKIPISSSDKNVHIENLKLSVVPGKNEISAVRSTTLKGKYKVDVQKMLLLYEDIYEAERKELGEEKSLTEMLEDNKKSRKNVDEVKNAFAEARKLQKDHFIDEAKGWFEQEITEMKNTSVEKMGIRHTSPDFVYSSSFQLGGLIKKAGNNIIIEIGKIQGSPFVVKPDQRKRDIDAYMPFARSIEYNIELEIPAGYTAGDVTSLNKRTENETGLFSAEVTADSKIIAVKLRKHYLNNFEPAKNWNQLIAFTDAANAWLDSKILLKKK